MLDILVIIPASGQTVEIAAPDNQSHLIDVVECVGELDFEIDGGTQGTFKRHKGDVIRLERQFKRFRVSGSPQTIRIGIGGFDDRSTHAPSDLTATIVGPIPIQTDMFGDTFESSSYLVPASGSIDLAHVIDTEKMVGYLISLDPLAPNPVRIQNDAGTLPASGGIWIHPGQPFRFMATEPLGGPPAGHLYAFNPGRFTARVLVVLEYFS